MRHLSSNDVVANPSDYITKAEHARILDSRLASKDYDATGEMARRVGSIEREAALRLAARDAELQAAAATQLRKVAAILLVLISCPERVASCSDRGDTKSVYCIQFFTAGINWDVKAMQKGWVRDLTTA